MILELYRQRGVLRTLIDKDFKSRYKAKALGRLWSVADPLVMVIIYTIVFVWIFRVGEKYYAISLLLGLTPFRFFCNSVAGAAAAINDNVQLVQKVCFPRIMLPLAVVLAHIRHFFIELGLVALLFLYFRDAFVPSVNLLWFPVIFLVQLVFVMGVSLVVAALNVRYRDTQYILNSVILVLTWATPIFYPFSSVPKQLAWLQWNPLVGVVEGYRSILMRGQAPDFTLLGAASLVSVLTLLVGLVIFRHYEHVFADYL